MALRQAKIQPTLQYKRYITLQFLEAAFMSGNRVILTPVTNYELSTLSKESFEYGDPIDTYIIYNERPKVSLLKRFGWFREDAEELPQIAFIPTHLLYTRFAWNTGLALPVVEPTTPEDGDQWFDEESNLLYTYTVIDETGSWDAGILIDTEEPEAFTGIGQRWFNEDINTLFTVIAGPIVNEILLEGEEYQKLIQTGVGDTYELRELEVKRGTILDIFFDFAPEPGNPGDTSGFYFAQDHSSVLNRFYVTRPVIDTVSINYTAKLMPYKYQGTKEDPDVIHFVSTPFETGGID